MQLRREDKHLDFTPVHPLAHPSSLSTWPRKKINASSCLKLCLNEVKIPLCMYSVLYMPICFALIIP